MKRCIVLLFFILLMLTITYGQINHQPALVPGTNENNTYFPINKKELSGIEIENIEHSLFGDYVMFSIKHDNYTIRISLYPKYRPEIDGPGFLQVFGSQLENEYRLNKKISSYMFNEGITKKKINSISYIDSIVLSAFIIDDIQYTRRVITSFDNYFLLIDILLNKDRVDAIFQQTPEYFSVQDGVKIWNFKMKKKEQAIDDIYKRKIKSSDALLWYDQTTEIISKIKYTFRE